MNYRQFEIRAQESGPVQVILYGSIGLEVLPREFVEQLRQLPSEREIELHVHSDGGLVWDAIAIHNALRGYRDRLTAFVDGIALSAASYIIMAAKKIVAPRNARLMIHDAEAWVNGDVQVLRETIEKLQRENEEMARVYAEKTGQPIEKIRAWMEETFWMTGAEAKAIGFVDELTEAVVLSASGFDLTRFKNAPRDLLTELSTEDTNMSENQTNPPTASVPPVENQSGPTDNHPPVGLEQTIRELQSRLEQERSARIEQRIQPLLGALSPDDTAFWRSLCLEQEENIPRLERHVAALRQASETSPTVPVGRAVQVTQEEGPAIVAELRSQPPGRERLNWVQAHWRELQQHLPPFQRSGSEPRAANTFDAGLVQIVFNDTVITLLTDPLIPWRDLMMEVRNDLAQVVGKPQKITVRYSTAAPPTLVNATNFTGGDSTQNAIDVTVNQYTQAFHVSNTDLQSGHRLAHILEINVRTLAEAINDAITSLFTTDNYGAGLVIGAASAFDVNKLSSIWEDSRVFKMPRKNLLLAPPYYSKLIPVNQLSLNPGETGAFGFTRIFAHSRFTGSAPNLVGVVMDPQGVVQVAGGPVMVSEAPYDSIVTVNLPVGLNVTMRTFFQPDTRRHVGNIDVIFGAAKADPNAVQLLLSE